MRCAPFKQICVHAEQGLGPPLSKTSPIPEFWMKSTLLQLSSKIEDEDAEQSRVALLEVAMSLVTRVLGIEAMEEKDRQLYLNSVRETGGTGKFNMMYKLTSLAGSLLGCIGKQILASGKHHLKTSNSISNIACDVGKLEAVCEEYKKYQYEKAVAAEEKRLEGQKEELQKQNAQAQTKSAEDHMRQTMKATRAVLTHLNPVDPVCTSFTLDSI